MPNALHIPRRLGWLILTVLAVYLAVTTLSYLSFQDNVNFLIKKGRLQENFLWRTAFYIHIVGGLVALGTGPWQFLKKFRNKRLRLHRSLGKVYLASILFMAGPTGLFMAFYSEGGLIGKIGFGVMAAAWVYTTLRAYETIRQGDINGHRAWMVRSFAMTFAAVTLRLYVPFSSYVLDLSMFAIDASSAWVSWVPNLIVGELILKFSKKSL